MTDFTVDEFITEMEKLFGVEDQGYIKVLEKAKELKKEVSITNKVAEDWEDSFNDQQKEIEKLKEQNEELQEDIDELKNEKLYTDTELDESEQECEKLKEENEELEEKITCLESDSYNEVSLSEHEEVIKDKDYEINKLKEKILKYQEKYFILTDDEEDEDEEDEE